MKPKIIIQTKKDKEKAELLGKLMEYLFSKKQMIIIQEMRTLLLKYSRQINPLGEFHVKWKNN